MDKKKRLNAIINHYSNGKPTVFAKVLGVAPSTISSWLSRNVLDYDLIFAKCEMISAHWLLTGEGEMIKSNNDEQTIQTKIVYKNDPKDAEIIASYKENIEFNKDLLVASRETIETQKDLIKALKQRISDLENSSSPLSSMGFPHVQSADHTHIISSLKKPVK